MSMVEFPPKVKEVANQLSACDSGPFPVWHGDFLHRNIIVDCRCRALGISNWEGACTAPWDDLEYGVVEAAFLTLSHHEIFSQIDA